MNPRREISRIGCGHDGPVLLEPCEQAGYGYTASCLLCMAVGPPQETHAAALEALVGRREERRMGGARRSSREDRRNPGRCRR